MGDQSDAAFLEAVTSGAFPRDDWGFHEFLRLLWVLSGQLPPRGARARAMAEMQRFHRMNAAGTDYFRQVHRTAIDAWLAILRKCRAAAAQGELTDLLKAYPQLGHPDYLLRFYSPSLLRSREARMGTRAPDRKRVELPSPGDPSGSPSLTLRTTRYLAPTEDFLARVEAGQIPRRAWGHQPFLRTVFAALRGEESREAARERVERALDRYDRGDEAGPDYFRQVHRTALDAWLHILEAAGVREGAWDFVTFRGAHPEFLDPAYLYRHFSRTRLRSPEARKRVLPPDRERLPHGRELALTDAETRGLSLLRARDRRRDAWAAFVGTFRPVTLGLGALAGGGLSGFLLDSSTAAEVILCLAFLLGILGIDLHEPTPDHPIERFAHQLRVTFTLMLWLFYHFLMGLFGQRLGPACVLLYLAGLIGPVVLVLVQGSGHRGATRMLPARIRRATTGDASPSELPGTFEVLARTDDGGAAPDAACPYCADPLASGAVRTCAACATPHHSDCWEAGGGCTTYGCGVRR
jgi:hypothetical protein